MPSFEQLLTTKKALVWNEMQTYLKDPVFPEAFAIESTRQDAVQAHWQAVREYPVRQGKYLRPLLVMLCAEAMGVAESKTIKTAAAMQLSEEWLLVHDDVEDQSPTRRGKPALHHLVGEAMAVNAGDTLHVIMWKVLVDNTLLLGATMATRIMDEFYGILMRTALGQSTELQQLGKLQADVTDEDYFFIADGKTGYYSIAGPLRLGALLAGANEDQLKALAELGLHLGRQFQIMDDILDVTTTFNGQKSQLGNDILEGKPTLLLGHLLRHANASELQLLERLFKKPRTARTTQEVSWVIAQMHHYGSIDYARQKAQQEGERALKKLSQIDFFTQDLARQRLLRFVEQILTRTQ